MSSSGACYCGSCAAMLGVGVDGSALGVQSIHVRGPVSGEELIKSNDTSLNLLGSDRNTAYYLKRLGYYKAVSDADKLVVLKMMEAKAYGKMTKQKFSGFGKDGSAVYDGRAKDSGANSIRGLVGAIDHVRADLAGTPKGFELLEKYDSDNVYLALVKKWRVKQHNPLSGVAAGHIAMGHDANRRGSQEIMDEIVKRAQDSILRRSESELSGDDTVYRSPSRSRSKRRL